jgi:hypothetical protein
MQAARFVTQATCAALLGLGALQAIALTPADIRKNLDATARQSAPGFAGFSAQRGRQFFASRHGNDWSCASCHTENPLAPGRHAKTGKDISPLAPAAAPQRFTDAAKVEKWFNRNCNDVLNRACTAQEKGDVLEYLISLGK